MEHTLLLAENKTNVRQSKATGSRNNRPPPAKFPFRTKLSFEPLINHWKHSLKSSDGGDAFLATETLTRLDKAPELWVPIEDLTLLDKHKELVELLMAGLFPSVRKEVKLAAATFPFDLKPFYHTPALQRFLATEDVEAGLKKLISKSGADAVIRACCLILNTFYDQNINVDSPLTSMAKIERDAIQQYYKSECYLDFLKVEKLKPLKRLSQEQINQLMSNINDPDLWLKSIPPPNFEFQGMATLKLLDATEEEALSRLKHRLLEKDAVVVAENVPKLEQLMRSYFNLPELRLGITAIDYPVENTVAHKYKIRYDFLSKKHKNLLAKKNEGSIYEKVCQSSAFLIIEDLTLYPDPTPIERDLLEEGIKSIIIAPILNEQNDVIGLLEIGSPHPFELNNLTELKFREIAPLFAVSVLRSREEIDNRIESIIREKFTRVHPCVEWKFIQNAFDLLDKREKTEDFHKVEPIVFKDVFPLYGQADIVGSSLLRNSAIQADFIDNLEKIEKVLRLSLQTISFQLLDHVLIKVQNHLERIKKGINSSDESMLIDFIQHEIHPLFEVIRRKHPALKTTVKDYYAHLDENLAIVYRKRKAYEESVALLNEAIGTYLEQEERKTQRMLPHYFAKYRTDGVEYDMYVGQFLLKKGKFSPIHLKNLRLWQLISMCEITQKVESLQDRLPVPLKTAQLIFVYSTPLSIRFRMDEQQFDVDGAYNVRYEILKKRIDKATIETTDERLTVSGKISIVYVKEKDKEEYLEYLEYLLERGYITGDIEDLTLSKLQGVQGLKALRVKVNTDVCHVEHPLNPNVIVQ